MQPEAAADLNVADSKVFLRALCASVVDFLC
jgi:hypothetical protein